MCQNPFNLWLNYFCSRKCTSKNLSKKIFFVKKKLESKKNLGHIFGSKMFWGSKTSFGSKVFFGQTIFLGYKNFFVNNFFVNKFLWSKNFLGQKSFWVKNFCQKDFGPYFFCLKKQVGLLLVLLGEVTYKIPDP